MTVLNTNPDTEWENLDTPTNDLNALGDGLQDAVWDGTGKVILLHTWVRRKVESQDWQDIL